MRHKERESVLEVLQFTFHCVWHFLGVLILIVVTLNGLAEIVAALRK
jgi:hypothetical protein